MLRTLVMTYSIFWLFPAFSQAAIQEAECYGGPMPAEKFADGPAIWQGSFRGLQFPRGGPEFVPNQPNEAAGWVNFTKFAYAEPYFKWGMCIYSGYTHLCGDASLDTQICWSEDPFTLANTNNGETCESTLPVGGIVAARDQTYYAISIDRSGAETTYCQIEFKTLATGDPVPDGPPGTGSTQVVGLATTDPETDQTPDGPTTPWPIFREAIATPFMPHFLLIGLTCLLATLGVRRVRRKRAA